MFLRVMYVMACSNISLFYTAHNDVLYGMLVSNFQIWHKLESCGRRDLKVKVEGLSPSCWPMGSLWGHFPDEWLMLEDCDGVKENGFHIWNFGSPSIWGVRVKKLLTWLFYVIVKGKVFIINMRGNREKKQQTEHGQGYLWEKVE